MRPARKTILKKKTRVFYIDVLNIVAILAVLFLHHNGIVHHFANSRSWYISLVVETAFYFAVPLFLMITGATLLNYREKYDTKTFFKKRAAKLIIPSLAWMIIMFIWQVFIAKGLTVTDWSPVNIINILLSNGELYIYYYLFVIMGIYLTIPLFTPLTEKKNRKLLWYGVICFFIFNTLVPDILTFFGIHFNENLSLRIGEYLVFVFLGYLLSTCNLTKRKRILLYTGGLLAIVYRYFTTALFSANAGTLVRTTWGYSSFHSIILASAVFVFIKNLPLDKLSARVKKTCSLLAGCSFGIYLSHILVMHYELLLFSSLFGMDSKSWIYRFLCPFLTYAISVLIVLLLKKIPFIRRIVP